MRFLTRRGLVLSLGVVLLASACGRSELADGWHADRTPGGAGTTGTASGEGGEGGDVAIELTFDPEALAPGRYKLAYAASFSVSGGNGPYTFGVAEGQLPPGLSLASDGRLAGTPTQPGSWSFVIEATDQLGAHAAREYELEIERNSLLAVQVFLSSSSARQDLLLFDLAAPGGGLLIRLEEARYYSFNPDGRWLKLGGITNAGTQDQYALPLYGDIPLAVIPLAESETSDPYCSWSPDSTKVACTALSSESADLRELSVRAITNTELGPQLTIDDTVGRYVRWISATRLSYYDANDRLSVAELGSGEVRTEQHLPSLSAEVGRLTLDVVPGQERCLVHTSGSAPRFFIVDSQSDVWQALPEYDWWVWAPGLNLAIGVGDTTSSLYAIDGVSALGPLDATGTGVFHPNSSTVVFAPRSPRFVAPREERAILSTLSLGGLVNVEIPGAYSAPTSLAFSPDERWLAIATDTELWLSELRSEGPSAAVSIADVPRAALTFAPDSSALVFVSEGASNATGGPPVIAAVVDLTSPPEFAARRLETEDEWASASFSNDSSYVVLLGASVTSGRAFHVYDLLNQEAPARLITHCTDAPSAEPSCPAGAEFQPWVALP